MRGMNRKVEVSRLDTSWGKKIFTFLLGVGSLFCFFILSSPSIWKPSPAVQQIINESAVREQLSPFLIEAVMLTESKFDGFESGSSRYDAAYAGNGGLDFRSKRTSCRPS